MKSVYRFCAISILLIGCVTFYLNSRERIIPTWYSPCITTWAYEKSLRGNVYYFLVCFDKYGHYAVYRIDKRSRKILNSSASDAFVDCLYSIDENQIYFDNKSFEFTTNVNGDLILRGQTEPLRFVRFDVGNFEDFSKDCTKLPFWNGELFGIPEIYLPPLVQ
jgi:hypothetical protein